MTLVDRFKNIENKLPLTLFGFVIALGSVALAIYLSVFYEKKPQLDFVITSNSSVLDIKESVGNLDVLYQGQSLSASSKELTIITFKVMNTGNDSILSSYYDKLNPVGFVLVNAKLAEAPAVMKTSSGYLKENIQFTNTEANKILLPQLVIDEGEFFEIKLLALHDVGKKPTLESVGKIAKVGHINIVDSLPNQNEKGIFGQVFSGSFSLCLVRLISYGCIFLILLITTLILIMSLDQWKSKRKRLKYIESFKDSNEHRINKADEYMFNFDNLRHQRNLERIHFALNIFQEGSKPHRDRLNEEPFHILVDHGYITITSDDQYTFDHKRAALFDDFFEYMVRKGEVIAPRTKREISAINDKVYNGTELKKQAG